MSKSKIQSVLSVISIIGVIVGIFFLLNEAYSQTITFLLEEISEQEKQENQDKKQNEVAKPRGSERYETYGVINNFPQNSRSKWVADWNNYTRDEQLKGTWIIGGEEYVADEKTIYKNSGGSFKEGRCIEFEHHLNSNVLLRIQSHSRDRCAVGKFSVKIIKVRVDDAPSNLYGTWLIAGRELIATKKTKFKDDEIGQFDCVELEYDPKSRQIVSLDKKWYLNCYTYK